METAVKASPNRVIFLDNLRWLFILTVIIGHSGNAYFAFTKWWPVHEETSLIVAWINIFFNGFNMPLLFYIAGYFTIPSIQKGIGSFLKGKFKRLGIPWLVCILTICPILPLIYHYTRNGLTLSGSYYDIWLAVMQDFVRFNVGVIDSIDEIMKNNGFYQRYMWFLSLLILFFLLFSVAYKFAKGWFDKKFTVAESEKEIPFSKLKLLLATGFLTFVFSFISILIMFVFSPGSKNPEAWFTLGNVFQFQVSWIFTYIVYFCLGILTYRNRWFERGKLPGNIKGWAVMFIVLLIGLISSITVLLKFSAMYKDMPTQPAEEISGMLFFFIRNFFILASLGFFLSLGMKYMNRPVSFSQKLAANSYNMYLSHYIFALVFQLVLFSYPGIPVLIKFIIVSLLAMACAYLSSEYLIRPYPKVTVVLLLVLLIVMFVVV